METQNTTTAIKSNDELEQEVALTMDEINAEKQAEKNKSDEVSDAEVKAAVERLHPDIGSMESRG